MAMRIVRLPATVRNVGRLYEILKVVARHGFGDIVARTGIEGAWRTALRGLTFGRYGVPSERSELRPEERIRMIFEELGPTYIKFGQILATRPDLIPMSLVQELRKLQDRVPPFDGAVARAIVEEELRTPIEKLFTSFDDTPLAAASIAQVHRAVLVGGDEVVVKVQRPGLRQILARDLDLLRQLAALLERDPEVRRWRPTALVEEFDKSIHKEIDFGREAHNIKKFAANFAGDPDIYVPRVYDDLSTDRVLTMEFIHGVKIDSEEIRKRPGLDREKIAKAGIRITLTQTFVHGFFHADPHPGNIFVLEGNVICLLDFGMMGMLDQERIDDLLSFLVCLLTSNAERMIRLLQRQGIVGERVNTRALKHDLLDLMDRYLGVDLARIDVATYIQAIFDVIVRHQIVLPADLMLIGKALATVDGIARDIYPELNPIEAIRPQVLQIYFRRLTDPEFYTRETRRSIEEALYLLHRLPHDLRLITSQLRDGTLRVLSQPDPEALELMLRQRSRAANRLAAAVLIVGLAAVSSYVLLHGTPWMQAFGVVGYAVAAVLTLSFFFGVVRSGGQ
ncbi:MAG: ubiquinone biosynthesis protein UbiB [Planctomycetota bacterium]|nr:MAG: ubiquinone biosynthesis protein UbiB [Planctomycetota bacterium]